ncbi:MAG TPA: porin, partial [Terriglobales bacterium]|nr:porin [Terriglobales bacterium]
MRQTIFLGLLFGAMNVSLHAQEKDSRIEELDKKLKEARQVAVGLQKTIDSLTDELEGLRKSGKATPSQTLVSASQTKAESSKDDFKDQILVPDLGGDERSTRLTARPELFVQTRYSAVPLRGTDVSTALTNFELSRIESRWSGALSDKVGMGFEIQYEPAPDGTPEQLVNDAFVEYYASDSVTLRAGQFVKPFGFDIQQSSTVRESPERGIFAEYFFPGERDRGFMVAAKLDSLGSAWKGTEVFAGAFNGNRFFADNNRQLNYDIRVRKHFERLSLAVGFSAQIGHQLLPDGVGGSDRENIYGADLQWAWKRLAFQPEGPYLLGGWSVGSTIALEMARQLQIADREVELLVALDGAPFNTNSGTSRWNPLYYWKLLRNLPLWVADDLMQAL